MDIVAGLPGLISLLSGAGPLAATAATLFIAVVGGLILFSRGREILAGTKAVEQGAEFQRTLLDTIKMMREDEMRLRTKLDALEAANGDLREDIVELKITLGLIRYQRRRLLALLRQAIEAGRLAPDALDPLDAVVPT